MAIHWDNFSKPLDQKLEPLPRLIADMDTTMRFLQARVAASHIDITLPQGW